ncbi:MAG: molybdopterin-containing oxidoreductase family protein [Ilumatobacteraceae bacterium]
MTAVLRGRGTDKGERVVHTACTLDCPDGCSLSVTVHDGRIVRVDASADNPYTDGWICAKVKKYAQRVYAPERVMTPLVRTGPKGAGEFRPISWDDAIALVVGRMRDAINRRGANSIAAFTYNSSSPAVESASMSEAFFAAIRATVVEHTICAATNAAAWESVFGSMNSADPRDVVHSDLVVVWGANPTVSNTHFAPLVQQAAARGARVVVVDPRRTAMAVRADLHLAVRPGTDVVLALAIANRWQQRGSIDSEFVQRHATGADELLAAAAEWTLERAADVCGIDAADIEVLADWWASTPLTLLRYGWGQERNANGGAACRAMLALPVLAGTMGRRGNGVLGAVRTRAVSAERRWPAESIGITGRRSVALHQVGRWLAPGATDPTEVVFVQGANPVVMCPDTNAVVRAFSRDDIFTVVHEQVLTDTCRYADVILPATTSFEIDDLATGYGSTVVQPVRAAISRVGESRSNDEVGLLMARAMGFDWSPPPAQAAIDDPGPREVVLPTLQTVDTTPGADRDHRARLVDPQFGVPRYEPVTRPDGYPLTLITPASPKLVNSMFGEFQDVSHGVQLHPTDAAARHLVDGQHVVVRSPLGSVAVPLEVRDDTRPGVAVMAKGVWLRHHPEGVGVNALCPDTGDELVNGACFNDTFIEVGPA